MIRIVVQNISKSFGNRQIFKALSVSFETGIYGISGPNGSGKSTLLKCLPGLIRPEKGTISWKLNDRSLENKERIRYTGFSAPYISMYGGLTCYENMDLLLTLTGAENRDEKIRSALSGVGIEKLSDSFYGKLSSGQQQRLRLAGALVSNPQVLMLDEPGTNLDKSGSKLVSGILSRAREAKKTVIIASNDSFELDQCDQLIHIEDFK